VKSQILAGYKVHAEVKAGDALANKVISLLRWAFELGEEPEFVWQEEQHLAAPALCKML
jgi:hypothetical protein